jgi:hypothetical protein
LRLGRKRAPDDAVPETPGEWWVDHEVCISCGAPPAVAPDLMGFGTNHSAGRSEQCDFKRQPRTADEIENACQAAEVSCCGALHYDGPDEAIRARVAASLPSPHAALPEITPAPVPPALRTVVAIVLSLAVLAIYQLLFAPKG